MGSRFQGSVHIRTYARKDGTTSRQYRAWEVVRFPNGTRRRVSASADTKIEAIAAVRKKARDTQESHGAPQQDRTTVADVMRQWLAHKEPRVEEPTFLGYESAARLHILPHIGKLQVASLEPHHVEATLSAVREKLHRRITRERTARMVYTTLSQALRYAVVFGIAGVNVCSRVERPRHTSTIIQPLTKDEAGTLLAAASGSRIEALIVLAITCGLRQGELFGLKWSDLNGSTLSVKRQVRDIRGTVSIVERTKNGSGRLIHLAPIAIDALKRHERMSKDAGPRTGSLIFTDTQGGMIRKRNFTRREFLPLLEKAGLKPMRFHDLRHTAATLLFQQNVHPKIVQEMLGHKEIGMTLDLYSAWIPSMGARAAEAMEDLFGAFK
jgi:integrase